MASSQLPLGLKPYHVAFVSYLSAIVLLGTFYSLLTGSHLNNLSSQPRGNEAFDQAASVAAAQRGASGSLLPPLSPTLVAPDSPLHYWANRKNIFNQVFVKKAWAWTTFAWALVLFLVKNKKASVPVGQTAGTKMDRDGNVLKAGKQPADKDEPTPATASSPVSISTLRWMIATACWLVFSGWFFGPPLAERVLTATGGTCVAGPGMSDSIDSAYCRSRSTITPSSHPSLFVGLSLGEKKALRPIWKGGHDISGHTFLMVLSALFLLEEVAGFLPYLLPSASTGLFPRQMWAVSNPFRLSRTDKDHTTQGEVDWRAVAAVSFALALVGLWSWMLLMTALYFHTPQEKITGLLVGLGAWLLLPKAA